MWQLATIYTHGPPHTGVSHVTVLSHVYVLHINEQGLATHLSVVCSSLNAGDPGNCQLQKVSRHLTYSRRTADILLGLVTSNCSITHTHPFNGPFSGTTRVSRYQKGKTNLNFTEARDSEWQWHQLGHMQVCISLQTDNHASTPPLFFYRPDCYITGYYISLSLSTLASRC